MTRRTQLGPLVVAALAGLAACGRSRADEQRRPKPDVEVEAVRAKGRELFFGRGGCNTCHRFDDTPGPLTGPNLGVGDGQELPLARRAWARQRELTPIEYVVESICDPDLVVVQGYARGVMKRYEEPPLSLSDEEIVALAAFVAGEGEGVAPLGKADLEKARQALPVMRKARLQRASAP